MKITCIIKNVLFNKCISLSQNQATYFLSLCISFHAWFLIKNNIWEKNNENSISWKQKIVLLTCFWVMTSSVLFKLKGIFGLQDGAKGDKVKGKVVPTFGL